MKVLKEEKLTQDTKDAKFGISSTKGTEGWGDWWPFHKPDWSACSSSSAKGIGAGTMKKEDINL